MQLLLEALQKLSRIMSQLVDVVKTIEFHVTDGASVMAYVAVEGIYAYYCFGTEDVREDGRVTLSEIDRSTIVAEIVEAYNNNDVNAQGLSDYDVKLSVEYNDGTMLRLFHKDVSKATLKSIIHVLSDRCYDLMFLMSFR